MNFRIITKNHAADSKITFHSKIDFRADGTHESHPTACELMVHLLGELLCFSKTNTDFWNFWSKIHTTYKISPTFGQAGTDGLITNDNESIWTMYIDIRNSVAIRDLNYGETNVSYGFWFAIKERVALTDDVSLRNWNKIKTCHFSTDKLTPGNALSPLILTDIVTKSPKIVKNG